LEVASSIYEAYKVAGIAKKINENCKIVMGDLYVSFLSEEIMWILNQLFTSTF